MTTIPVSDVPLKERYYIYRRYTLHQRTSAATADDLYWQIKGGTVTTERVKEVEKRPPKGHRSSNARDG